jgi:hypothetical protein
MHDLLAKLKAGASAIRRVALPRKDGEGPTLGLRILTESDATEAALAALDALRARGHEDATVANADLFESARAVELLARALVDPADGKPLAKDAGELCRVLTRADKVYLIDQYLDHEREYSPSEAHMDGEAFAELLDEVKKNPATPRLNDFSSALLKRLVRSLAAPEQI